jgi:hypothetical protein
MEMRGSTAARFAVWGVTLAALAALVIAATGMTGAYFSDTHHGDITGNIGSIKVTPSGGTGADGTDFTFANLLPGEPQTATIQFQNTGLNAEDVWLVFDNATALSALNNLGRYGEVHVSNGHELFASTNLNDRITTCGTLSPAGCWPLPSTIKVADGVAPGAGGYVKFSFNYAGKLSSPAAEGQPFNVYPAPDQFTVNTADGTGSGLPYEIVATQVGQTP